MASGIQVTGHDRVTCLAARKPIPEENLSQDRLPDDASPSWLFGSGGNIRGSAFLNTFINRFRNMGIRHYTDDRYKEVWSWYAQARSPEILSPHYGYHRCEGLQVAAVGCETLGWTDVAKELRDTQEDELCLLACFSMVPSPGDYPPADNVKGPLIVHGVLRPTKVKSCASMALCGPRSESYWKGGHWLAFPDSWMGGRMISVDQGQPVNDNCLLAMKAAGLDTTLTTPETRALIQKAMRGDKAALEECWRRGKSRLNSQVHIELIRTTGGIMARHLGSAGGNIMKGPKPAVVILNPVAPETWCRVYGISNTGSPTWPPFSTAVIGGQVSVTFPAIKKTLSVDLPPGDTLLRVTFDGQEIPEDEPTVPVDDDPITPDPPPIKPPITVQDPPREPRHKGCGSFAALIIFVYGISWIAAVIFGRFS